jgi:hypothetical protein
MRLTDIGVKTLPAPPQGQKTYRDDTLTGFGVRVSQGGSKTFVLVHGADRRFTTVGGLPGSRSGREKPARSNTRP